MILFTAKNSSMGAVTWVCTPSRSTMTHTSGWPLAARTWSTNLRGCINISGETDPFSLQLKLAVCGTPPMVVVGAPSTRLGPPGAGKRKERGDGLEGGQRATEP